MDIKGKTILITGGAKRLGGHLANYLAGLGGRIVLHYHASENEAESLALQTGAQLIRADFSDPAELDKFSALKADVLINNASIYLPGRLLDADAEALQKHFQVNFFFPLLLARQIMRNKPAGGVVINMLDQEVLSPTLLRGAYSLSKAALRDATKMLALEAAPAWRVAGIAPGPMLPPPYLPESRMENELKKVPMRRKVGLDEIASTVLWILQNESVTGAIIPVDGGQHLNLQS